jgi:hypothetical protein
MHGSALGLITVFPERRASLSGLSRMSSVASPRRRLASRSEALAALEGRLRGKKHASKPRARNFMSMSDEEDEDDEAEAYPYSPITDATWTSPRPAPLPPTSAPAASKPGFALARTPSRASRRTTLSLAYALAPTHPTGSFFELDDEEPPRALAIGRSFIDIGVSAF